MTRTIVAATVVATSDHHRVLLGVVDAPLVDNRFNSVRIVPENVTLLYRRENTGVDYQLIRIEVDGARARRDGTPGAARSDVSFDLWTWTPEAAGVPEWLLRLGRNHLPAGLPVAREFPAQPDGTDLPDLDAIT